MRFRHVTVAVVTAVLALGVSTAGASGERPEAPEDRIVEAIPRSQRVAVFADSVGLGAKAAIAGAFPAGWEVNLDGQPARFVEQLENDFVKYRLAASPHWFGDHVVIAGGYNYPYWDPERFDRSIDSMIRTLTEAGVKHVYWVTLREIDPQYISASAWRQVQPYYWYFPTVNSHLERALTRHPNLTLVDWAAAANRPGITYDAIHLNTTGAALYSSLIASTVHSTATTVADGSTTKIRVPDADGAAAAMVNLTTTHPRRAGHLTVHRCDQDPPRTSVHNFTRSQVVAHAAIAPLDTNGDFCVTTLTQTNLVVDVTGTLRPDAGYVPVGPLRWHDTRTDGDGRRVNGGSTLRIDLDDVPLPANATDPAAVAINVTAAAADGLGHLTVSRCGTDADHSNVNFVGAAATPNLVFVEPDDNGEVCVFTTTTTHIVVDLFGTFDDTSGISVTTPTRLVDSRRTGSGAKVAAGGVVEIDLSDDLDPASSGAIVNLTGVLPDAPGHFTAYPCAAGVADSSNLNLGPGDVVANAALLAPDADGKLCVSTHSSSHVVVDLLGEIGAVFEGRTPERVLDTRRR